jgi:hypothetical protein
MRLFPIPEGSTGTFFMPLSYQGFVSSKDDTYGVAQTGWTVASTTSTPHPARFALEEAHACWLQSHFPSFSTPLGLWAVWELSAGKIVLKEAKDLGAVSPIDLLKQAAETNPEWSRCILNAKMVEEFAEKHPYLALRMPSQ